MAAAERRPSVVVSHVDIVYRVYGSRARTSSSTNLRSLLSRADRAPRTVHAVKDASFVAHHGEAIGIIGRNGSGKSTILRAVAGLIPPTNGRVWADGSPALLGVNAVLVQSLSGSRNIYIGAQALGLSRAEVDAVYDEVVEFSELGDAIHLPMSTYSSGMAARLRFAISTAATPGVLIIDEALATGDAHFRRRSQERIKALRDQASTVFLVSHSANTVREMCDRVIWLDQGVIVADGPVDEVVDRYEASGTGRGGRAQPVEPEVPGVERWSGGDRYATSSYSSARTVESAVDQVYLAPGQDVCLALAAVSEAVRTGSPVLLTRQRTLPRSVAKELKRLAPAEVVLVGDEETVRPAVEESLTKAGFAVRRIAGEGPVDTVAALVDAVGPPLGSHVQLVPHGDEPAALVAALRAAGDGGVVLLTQGEDHLPDLVDVVGSLAPASLTVLGDETDIPSRVVDALRPSVSGAVTRHLTPSPADASVEVSTSREGAADVVYLASAATDAVTAASIAAMTGMPFLLVDRDEVPSSVDAELRRLRPAHLVVLGGPASVTPDLRRQLAEYLANGARPDAQVLDAAF